jgi:hypothetical protein
MERFAEILPSKIRVGNVDLGTPGMTRGPVPTCGLRTKLSIDSAGWNRYTKRIRCENRARVLTDARRDAQQGQPGVACSRVSRIPFFILGAKRFGGEIQRPRRMRQQQLSWKHSGTADHPRGAERVQHLGRARQTCARLPGVIERRFAAHWENPEHRSARSIAKMPCVSRLVGPCRTAR